MCQMLYLGSAKPLPLVSGDVFSVNEVHPANAAVRQWFGGQHVCLAGAHTRCGCGFPSVLAEVAIEYYEGMFDSDDPENRKKDLQSLAQLFAFLQEHAAADAPVKLYSVWDGSEDKEPKGTVRWNLSELEPATMVFTDGFMYEVHPEPMERGEEA